MSLKRWYILESNHHLGPFDDNEIMKRAKDGRISHKTVLWREGFEDWVPFDKIEELKSLFHKLTSINPYEDQQVKADILMTKMMVESTLKREQTHFEQEIMQKKNPAPKESDRELKAMSQIKEALVSCDSQTLLDKEKELYLKSEELPPIPIHETNYDKTPPPLFALPDAPHLEVASKSAPPITIKQVKVREIEDPLIMTSTLKKRMMILPTLLIVFFIASIGLYYFANISGPRAISFPTNIAPEFMTDFKRISMEDSSVFDIPRVVFASSLSGRDLYVATNSREDLEIMIQLNSVVGKTLGKVPTSLSASTWVSQKTGHFTEFRVNVGNEVAQGYYDLEATIIKRGLLVKIILKLQSLPWVGEIELLKSFTADSKYRGRIILTSLSELALNKALKGSESQKSDTIPTLPIFEFQKSFDKVLDDTVRFFTDHLGRAKTGRGLNPFMREFQAEIMPTLIFLRETYQSEIELKLELESFEGLVRETVKKGNKVDRFSRDSKTLFIKEFVDEIDLIRNGLEQRVNNLKSNPTQNQK